METKENNIVKFDYQGKALDYGLLDNEPVFNLKAISVLLDIKNLRQNININDTDYVLKLNNSIVCLTYNRKLNNRGELFLTEAGLYRVLMRSDKPEAQKFQKWVTKDVLPNIRKKGFYHALDSLQNNAKDTDCVNLSHPSPCRDIILWRIRQMEAERNRQCINISKYKVIETMNDNKIHTKIEVTAEFAKTPKE